MTQHRKTSKRIRRQRSNAGGTQPSRTASQQKAETQGQKKGERQERRGHKDTRRVTQIKRATRRRTRTEGGHEFKGKAAQRLSSSEKDTAMRRGRRVVLSESTKERWLIVRHAIATSTDGLARKWNGVGKTTGRSHRNSQQVRCEPGRALQIQITHVCVNIQTTACINSESGHGEGEPAS